MRPSSLPEERRLGPEVLGELEVIAGRRRERVGRSRLGKMGMIRESRVRVRYYTEGPTRNFWKV